MSATTANVIYGSQPDLINPDMISSNLSFSLAAKTYKASDGSYSNSLLLPAGSKLTDFKINALSDNDFSITDNFKDDDGDYILNTNQFTRELPTFRWLDRTGAVIPISAYNQTIGGCSTTLKAPLTLEISAKVGVTSSYGIPRDSAVVTIVKRYSIISPALICYLRPNSLEWVGTTDWGTGSSVPDKKTRGGGFNSSVFDDKNGFLLNAKFPTTGFVGAQFKLTMDRGSQADYNYSVITGTGVTVDTNGLVSLNSKPSSTVILRVSDKTIANRYIDYSFVIKTWVVPKATKGSYEQLLKLCGNNAANIPSPTTLTNSPQNTFPATIVTNYYTRDVGTVFSEWGQTIKQKYNKSDWHSDWSNMPYFQPKTSSKGRYTVSSLSGAVMMSTLTNTSGYIICKG